MARDMCCRSSRSRSYPVDDQVLDTAAEAVRVILADGVQAAMNRFNRKPEAKKQLATSN